MRIPFLGGIGVPELIVILVIVLIIFGPKNLPKLGNAIGRTVKSMRDGMDGKKKKDEGSASSSDKVDAEQDDADDEVIVEDTPKAEEEASSEKSE